jgi:hypothetical protein
MSRENVEPVRQPLRVRERSSRTLDQRLALRFPRLAAAFARMVFSLPPRSRLRKAAASRVARLALEAYNRRDLDAVAISFHPDLEYYPYREFVDAGCRPRHSGSLSRRRSPWRGQSRAVRLGRGHLRSRAVPPGR